MGFIHRSPLHAQQNNTPPDSSQIVADHQAVFQESLTLSIELINDPPIQKAVVFLSTPQFRTAYQAAFEIDALPGSGIQFEHVIDLNAVQIEPFVPITYWWQFETEDGQLYELTPIEFEYRDTRFTWEEKTAADGQLTVFWSSGRSEGGQVALDLVQEGLAAQTRYYQTTLEQPTRIYLYPSVASLQSVFDSEWLGGAAIPSDGRLFLATTNDRTAVVDLSRQIPHELSHLFVAQLTADNPAGAPRWFDEGLAVRFEQPPNERYAPLLAEALQAGSLIPFEALCDRFPTSSADLLVLAYAQSGSFLTYIEEQYGQSAIRELLAAFNDGATCATAIERVLDQPLPALEQAWRTAVTPTSTAGEQWARKNLFWIVLLLGGFGLMGFLAIGNFKRPG